MSQDIRGELAAPEPVAVAKDDGLTVLFSEHQPTAWVQSDTTYTREAMR